MGVDDKLVLVLAGEDTENEEENEIDMNEEEEETAPKQAVASGAPVFFSPLPSLRFPSLLLFSTLGLLCGVRDWTGNPKSSRDFNNRLLSEADLRMMAY